MQISGIGFGEGGVVEMVVSPPLFADQIRKIVCDRLFDTEGRKRDRRKEEDKTRLEID